MQDSSGKVSEMPFAPQNRHPDEEDSD